MAMKQQTIQVCNNRNIDSRNISKSNSIFGARTVVFSVMNGATKQLILPHIFHYLLEELTNTSVSFLILSSVSRREE
jgi:hypothetical protein